MWPLRSKHVISCLLRFSLLSTAAGSVCASAAPSLPMPQFRAENDWLKLPNGWMLGEVSGVDVDRAGHIWILQRPRTLASADRAHAAPPVMEFAPDGTYLSGFGGDGPGYDWPLTEHSIAVDGEGHVWISGNFRTDPATNDDALLEFDRRGRFVRQIGGRGDGKGNADTSRVGAAADLFVDDAEHALYVADGYLNRRVIVFDTRKGRFKRMWGAFGAPPPATPTPPVRTADAPFVPETGDGPAGFNGVHGVEISRDGLVYVSDRSNQRIQVFTKEGKYLRQTFVDRNQPSPATASGIAFSADRGQRYLYVADFGNAKIVVLDRSTLAAIGVIGGRGTGAGQFSGPHLIATGKDGTLYVADVMGRRLTRLVPH
jgi:hypothetical protein